MSGKCPKCEQEVTPTLRRGPSSSLASCYTAVCPNCETILGVIPDPDDIAKKSAGAVRLRPPSSLTR
jgi:hypothetical protein